MGLDFRKKRKSMGYSIEKLAEKSGVSASTIKNIEHEKCIPRKVTFELFAKALDLSVDYEEYYESLFTKKKNHIKDNVKEKLSMIEKLYMNGEYEEAIDIYLDLGQIFDEESMYLYKSDLIYSIIEQLKYSINCWQKLSLDEESRLEVLLLKGECLALVNKNEEAKEVFQKVIKIKEDEKANYHMGTIFEKENNFKEAIIYYEKSIKIAPKFYLAYLNMSQCYFKLNNLDESIKYAKKTIELNENVSDFYTILGNCYKKMKEYKKAIYNYKKSLSLDKNNEEALCGVFISLALIQNEEEMESYFSKFINNHSHMFLEKENINLPQYETLLKLHKEKLTYIKAVEKVKEYITLLTEVDKNIYSEENNLKSIR